MRRTRPIALFLAVAAVPLVACGGGTDPDYTLQALSSCEALDEAIHEQTEEEISWRFRWRFPISLPTADDMAGTPNEVGGQRAYTDTNVQVAGVDEPDLVETDGTWLYALTGGALLVNRAWPPEETAEAARLAIEGRGEGMMLDREAGVLAVLSQLWEPGRPLGADPVPSRAGWGLTKVTLVDVADPAAPQILREVYLDGAFQDARLLGGRLYVAAHYWMEPDEIGQADSARAARRALDDTRLDDWLPRRRDHVRRGAESWDVQEDRAVDCGAVWASERRSGNFMTTLSSLEVADPTGEISSTGVLGGMSALYANHRSLYLASLEQERDTGPWASFDSHTETVVHRFDLTGTPAVPAYAASGSVKGHVLNQFSMDEHASRLRLATTDVDGDVVEGRTSAGVYVLEERSGVLHTVGRLEGLAPGERIFAARFLEDMGYLVTFRQMDPLFTIDLSDPAHPVQRGELEITGFSSYLHPIAGDRLLAVGMAGTPDGFITAPQVSLFDVSDPDAPALESRLVFEDAGDSEAGVDHHAFTFLPEAGILVLPLSGWDAESSLAVVRLTPGEGLTEVGRLRQAGVLAATGADAWCAPFRRSVVIEGTLYGMSAAGLTVAPLEAPASVVATVPFQGVDYCADPRMW